VSAEKEKEEDLLRINFNDEGEKAKSSGAPGKNPNKS